MIIDILRNLTLKYDNIVAISIIIVRVKVRTKCEL